MRFNTKRTFVPGTYTRVPDRLLSYRLEYKQVGKNVFVVAKGKAALDPKLTISAALELFNKSMPTAEDRVTASQLKLKDLIDSLTRNPPLVRATPAQLADYTKRKSAYDDFVTKAKAEAEAKRLAARKVEIDRAVRVLKSKAPSLLTMEASLGVQTKPEVAENKYSEDLAKSRRAPKANAL